MDITIFQFSQSQVTKISNPCNPGKGWTIWIE